MTPLPIQRFEIVHYRGLEEVALDDPRRFNLLVGSNNRASPHQTSGR